ncbi:MAG: hypothetical protein IJS69_04970 [Selenomonadaceae bacterium]|nr:hypothetical protein [Selenomonadaceae bacterium]
MPKGKNFAHIDREHARRVEEYNSVSAHPCYSRPCKVCGTYFAGRDWLRAETDYCSKKCELADYEKISPERRHEINLWWRDFGKGIVHLA